MRRSNLILALAFSLVVHLAVIYQVRFSVPTPTESPPVVLERIIENRRGDSQKIPAPRTLRDLGIGWKTGEEGARFPDGLIADGPEVSVGDTTGALADLPHLVAYEQIYDRIDHALFYPPEFQDAGIEGEVKAEIRLTDGNVFLEKNADVRSSSRYLRVWVVQVLRRAFREPLGETFRRAGRDLRIRAHFRFDMTQSERPLDTSKDGQVGRTLSFYRFSKIAGAWKLGPLAGYAIAPSLGVDPEWFVEEISHAFSNKAPSDPLLRYRSDPAF